MDKDLFFYFSNIALQGWIPTFRSVPLPPRLVCPPGCSQFHHHFLLPSIHHSASSSQRERLSSGKQNNYCGCVTGSSTSPRLRLSECQLFLKLVSPPASPPSHPLPPHTPPLLSHGDVGPAIAVGQSCCCLRCAHRASSLEGSGDRLISPGARSPGKEGNIKKKR